MPDLYSLDSQLVARTGAPGLCTPARTNLQLLDALAPDMPAATLIIMAQREILRAGRVPQKRTRLRCHEHADLYRR